MRTTIAALDISWALNGFFKQYSKALHALLLASVTASTQESGDPPCSVVCCSTTRHPEPHYHIAEKASGLIRLCPPCLWPWIPLGTTVRSFFLSPGPSAQNCASLNLTQLNVTLISQTLPQGLPGYIIHFHQNLLLFSLISDWMTSHLFIRFSQRTLLPQPSFQWRLFFPKPMYHRFCHFLSILIPFFKAMPYELLFLSRLIWRSLSHSPSLFEDFGPRAIVSHKHPSCHNAWWFPNPGRGSFPTLTSHLLDLLAYPSPYLSHP